MGLQGNNKKKKPKTSNNFSFSLCDYNFKKFFFFRQNLTEKGRQPWNSQSSCLSLSSLGCVGRHKHAWKKIHIDILKYDIHNTTHPTHAWVKTGFKRRHIVKCSSLYFSLLFLPTWNISFSNSIRCFRYRIPGIVLLGIFIEVETK